MQHRLLPLKTNALDKDICQARTISLLDFFLSIDTASKLGIIVPVIIVVPPAHSCL
jgi:hypothetical protein